MKGQTDDVFKAPKQQAVATESSGPVQKTIQKTVTTMVHADLNVPLPPPPIQQSNTMGIKDTKVKSTSSIDSFIQSASKEAMKRNHPQQQSRKARFDSIPVDDYGRMGNDLKSVAVAAEPKILAAPTAVSNHFQTIPTPSRSERKIMFGIDCADLVHFARWEPGGEHVKQLVVKNVVMKTQKIKYKLPQTRYFSMEFPETITLSAGMSWTIPITFRPVAKECYKDVIEFTTSFGKFFLPIKATLPEHVLEFPESLDFKLCPLRETGRLSFTLKNVGELGSAYVWDIPKPFSITPQSGVLPTGQSVSVNMDFKPEDASVFTARAICTFGDKDNWENSKVVQPMTVYGIGKYSHIAIEGGNHVFDFGDVFVGRSAEKNFILENRSAVRANFKIKQSERDIDPYFEFSTLSGSVGSHKKLEISIMFTPAAAGMLSTEYFDITTLSGNSIRITCVGRGVGPQVTLNTSVVNFNDVSAGTTASRSLYIYNNSGNRAFYQFLSEHNSIFRIDKPWGTINPYSSFAITLKFSPTEPINYYRRVYCLVEHQDGIYVDLLGNCYNEKRRPATFVPKMVENYKQRVKNGLWSFGPEQLEDMLKSGIIKCEDGILCYVNPKAHEIPPKITDLSYADGQIASEYFFENTGSDQAVTLLDSFIDFGSCSRYRVIDNQIIRVANNTKGKMSCFWHMPGETTGEDLVFEVSPKVADIMPKSFSEFRVSFRPRTDNSFYGAQLECFVYFKSMRNFRLVNDETFTPPWCMTPMVAGNTFPPGEDTFIPKIDFGATRLDFPSCHVDRSVYRTVRVSNTGDTPVKFAFMDGVNTGEDRDLRGSPFSVKPRFGVLSKNESKLIVFRFNPSEQRAYEHALKCYFNSAFSNAQDFHVHGVGYFPQLSFDNNNTLVFKPTCVESVSRRSFKARNSSRISVNFEWKIPEQYASFVSIEPSHGSLAPNSELSMSCSFSPVAAKNFVLHIPCYFSHAISHDNEHVNHEKRKASLTLIGKGDNALLTSEPQMVDFGAVLVNSIMEKEIVLFNPSECDVFYTLEVYRVQNIEKELDDTPDYQFDNIDAITKDTVAARQAGLGEDASLTIRSTAEIEILLPNNMRESDIDIIQSSDTLPARSHHCLKVRVCMREQTEHRFRIYYRKKAQSSQETSAASQWLQQPSKDSRVFISEVTVIGVHPVVRVTDVHSDRQGKALLWKHLTLDMFNTMLESVNPNDPEMSGAAFVIPDVEETFADPHKAVPIKETPSLDFNFGAAAIGERPAVIEMSLLNPGVVPVEWVFYFPNDLEVEVENWADPGDYTEDQLHTNLILFHSLFTISPKSGVLNPGESEQITMTYKYSHAGFHKLPIIFKLKNGSTSAGKEIILYFVGLTLQPTQKCLHFNSNHHVFQPVSIGSTSVPIQSVRLANHGCVTLNYFIDTAPLKTLKSSEHDFEVFKCLNQSGSIPPGGVEYVDWIFRPLEVKSYEVDVPIKIDDDQIQIITFSGKGYHDLDVDELLNPKSLDDTIPPVQKLIRPSQVASLSIERINFGHVPMGASLRQLVSVKNISNKVDITFKWCLPESSWGKGASSYIKFSPASGRLAPGETQICKLIFSPLKEVRILERDIICEITNLTEMDQIHANREAVEFVRRETFSTSGSTHSTIFGRSPKSASSIGTVSGAKAYSLGPVSGSATKDGTSTRGSRTSARSDADLRSGKFSKLPDIGTPPKTPNAGENVKSAGSSRSGGAVASASFSVISSESEESNYVPETIPLFLSIFIQVHSVEEFRSKFFGYETFFFPRQLNHDHIESDDEVFSNSDILKQAETLLSTLLDDIILDQDVQLLLDPKQTSGLPYFAQITSRRQNGIHLVMPLLEKENEDKTKEPDSVELVAGFRKDEEIQEKILSSNNFQNSVETILESTLFNLMQEADMHEFDMTRESLLVWIDQPLLNSLSAIK